MKERKHHVIWEDHDHAWAWNLAFDKLRERGYEITVFSYLTPDLEEEREKLLKSADVFVIHSGTVRPPDLREFIKDIKEKTGVKVFLQTEAVNELTKPLIDGVIGVYCMNNPDELERILLGRKLTHNS